MGSWSESCGFSGIEIGEGEYAYVMLMEPASYRGTDFGPYNVYEPSTTLVRGFYNDYGILKLDDDQGVIDIFCKQSGLTLENGGEYHDRDEDGKIFVVSGQSRFWIREDIFNRIGEIQEDFGMCWQNGECFKYETVKEGVDLRMNHLRDDLGVIAAKGYTNNETLRFLAPTYNLYEIKNNEPTIEAIRRNLLLHRASDELRKKLVPSEKIGPQHGGSFVIKQYAKMLLEVEAERESRLE